MSAENTETEMKHCKNSLLTHNSEEIATKHKSDAGIF